jgi:hypothetical protein
MIKLIERVNLYDRGHVEMYDFSEANSSHLSRVKHAIEVAKTCRDLDRIKNPEALYKRLLTEHAGRMSEVLQFIPVEFGSSFYSQRYIHFHEGVIRTNLRNYEIENDAIFNEKVDGFCVFKVKIPLMIAAQIRAHGNLSINQMSERHVKSRQYYYCEEFDCIKEQYDYQDWDEFCYNSSEWDFDLDMSKYKIRQELLNKGSHGLSYTKMWISGWITDPDGLQNFFKVRTKKPTQKELFKLAIAMQALTQKHTIDKSKIDVNIYQ